ncbi:MAG: division/cell wall cluster transcriptional repressor MraZ [Bacteroides sp.]|nr:division/cell wall cluster transcriptional repressor MraZ [Eubacterium sp.]MCM1418331.1 division/cell wall cluster transcriptional repressor MraZ [Roseburia sp.]MCM1463396.1 division/cell wall cluster transcriptional repressor MraZ [Bacteroides sp.]
MLEHFLCGEFKSTLDAKGRMNFPVKLREAFGESFVIAKTIGAECIKVYSAGDWSALVEKINAMPQTRTADIQRFLFGSAFEIEPDKQGRMLIPAPLREYAGLKTEVVIVGLSGRAEIWDKAKWDEMNAAQSAADLAETAMELGI